VISPDSPASSSLSVRFLKVVDVAQRQSELRFAMKKAQSHRSMVRRSQGALAARMRHAKRAVPTTDNPLRSGGLS